MKVMVLLKMIVTLHVPGRSELNIYDCPGEYEIIQFRWVASKCTIIKYDNGDREKTVLRNAPIPHLLIGYACVSESVWKFFHDQLGYVPFYEEVHGLHRYIPHTHYNTIEEIKALRKPIEFVEFMEYKIPKAIMNHMTVVCKLSEDLGEPVNTIEFPPHIQPYVEETLKKLNTCHEHSYGFTLGQMAVCDFLGLMDIFNSNCAFVFNGDYMLLRTSVNLFSMGILSNTYDETIFYPDIDDVCYNDPLLTDTIVETSSVYKHLEKYNKSDLALRAMKLILSRSGYL